MACGNPVSLGCLLGWGKQFLSAMHPNRRRHPQTGFRRQRNSDCRLDSAELWSCSHRLPPVECFRFTTVDALELSLLDLGSFILNWGDSIHIYLLCSKSMETTPCQKVITKMCTLVTRTFKNPHAFKSTTSLCITLPTTEKEKQVGQEPLRKTRRHKVYIPVPTCSSLWSLALDCVSCEMKGFSLCVWNFKCNFFLLLIYNRPLGGAVVPLLFEHGMKRILGFSLWGSV